MNYFGEEGVTRCGALCGPRAAPSRGTGVSCRVSGAHTAPAACCSILMGEAFVETPMEDATAHVTALKEVRWPRQAQGALPHSLWRTAGDGCQAGCPQDAAGRRAGRADVPEGDAVCTVRELHRSGGRRGVRRARRRPRGGQHNAHERRQHGRHLWGPADTPPPLQQNGDGTGRRVHVGQLVHRSTPLAWRQQGRARWQWRGRVPMPARRTTAWGPSGGTWTASCGHGRRTARLRA